MKCSVYGLGTLKNYKYVIVFARYNNQWIICKHKNRNTWETAGGHIEQGETPIQAAKRELHEETGAVDFEINPVCDWKALWFIPRRTEGSSLPRNNYRICYEGYIFCYRV